MTTRKAAAAADDENPSELQREVRLGLVMYGGVSLAIYINGVAREFFRAVRGAGVYRFVKALTDSDVIVDVISGTSAGGINGIMLAYALCNRKEFASCANLWRLDGDIRSLLRSPHGDPDSTESLFNSEGYYQPRLEAAFRDMADYVPEEGDIESDFPELDLFITGTDVDGHITTQFDDAGHPIDVKDHRSVFLLKHRRGRKTPFDPRPEDGSAASPETTFQALAKLSRITSCFPAAFTPVHVAADKPCDDTVDGKLQLWGDLGKDATFLDGGVIDNKPFTYTIREIFNRVADREVERKLFYVEPDPERFAKLDAATQPNFVQAVFASLIGIPSYESIADDLQLLAKHNSQIKQFQRLRDYLESKEQGEPLPDREKMSETEKKLFDRETELYDKCALIALSERVVRGILREGGRDRLMVANEQRAARDLIDTFDEVQKEMQRHRSALDEPGSSGKRAPVILQNFDVYYRMRRLHRTVYKLAEVLRRKNEESADRAEVNKYANLWRLLNREIELLEIIRVNMERLIDTAPISWAKEIGAAKHRGEVVVESKLLWAAINASLERLMSLTEDEELSNLLKGEADYKNPKEILDDAFGRIHEKTAAVDHARDRLVGFDRQTLSLLNKSLKLRSKVIVPGIDQTREELRSRSEAQREQRAKSSRKFEGLLMLTSDFERRVINDVLKDAADADEQAVRDAYFNFEHVDTQLYPIELVSGLYEKDIIETIRISPRDAEKGFSKRGLSDKVSGDALYHFGGFFKRSWRSNDILWGRLDGLCQLVETLLDPDRIGRVLRNPLQLERVRRKFFKDPPGDREAPNWAAGMDPKELFPNAGAKTHKEISDWLLELLWDDGESPGTKALKEKHERLLDGEAFGLKLERIIEAAQLEILHEEVPNVVTDALEEQARWNQFHFPRMEPKSRGARREKGRRKWLVFGERAAPAAPSGEGANGQKGPEDLNPFVYTPSEGALDPFVSVLAAAGAAHDVMRRFKQNPSNPYPERPSQTDLGRFFNNAYRIGSEALLRDMPLLVLLEILSVSLLVLRNCVLKIFGESASRIKSHPLYVVLIDFPLRAFNTLVIFMRRVPTSKKWLPVALFGLALLLLVIGVGWRNSIIWVTTYDAGGRAVSVFYLRWFLVFIAAPLVVLFAQGVYLYQGKVNDWNWLRGLRNALIGLLLLAPVFFVIVGYVALYEVAKDALTRRGQYLSKLGATYLSWLPGADYISRLAAVVPWGDLAGFAVTTAFLLTLVGPLIAFKLLSWLTRSRRARADRLLVALKQYFSLQDMLEIERRLQLFSATEREKLACKIGYLSEDDLAKFSRSTGLRRKLFETLSGDEKKITLDQVLARLTEVERDEKQRAYAGLQRALETARAGQNGETAAAAPAAGEDARAADAFYRRMREIEDEKTILVEELVANTNRADKKRVEAAGETLAEMIVSKARQIDREQRANGGKKWKGDEGGKLAQLEEAMHAINPEALR